MQAGEAFAVRVELGPGQAGAQVSATMYQAGAAAGASGFQEVVSGPMGTWTGPAAGHQTFAQARGCAEDDTVCTGLYDFGVHPGETFVQSLEGSYVASASGAVLMRVVVSCDIPFYADVGLESCHMDDVSYGCVPDSNGVNWAHCASELAVTVTPGAFYQNPNDATIGTDPAGAAGTTTPGSASGATDPTQVIGGGDATLVIGSAVRVDSIVIDRAMLEEHAAAAAVGSDSDRHPTMEELLIAGTPEASVLAAMFTKSQEPYLVFPLTFTPITAAELVEAQTPPPDTAPGGGHRRMQPVPAPGHIST